MTDKLKALLVRQIPEPSASVQEHPLIQYIESLEARIAAVESAPLDLAALEQAVDDLAGDVADLDEAITLIDGRLTIVEGGGGGGG
jgi:hypothetical protein